MKTKNKPGRKGVKRRNPSGMFRGGPTLDQKRKEDIDTTRPEYEAGFRKGWTAGFGTAQVEEIKFLQVLLEKRNAKDIKGLIDRRLDLISA